jgi:hypothetical protein
MSKSFRASSPIKLRETHLGVNTKIKEDLHKTKTMNQKNRHLLNTNSVDSLKSLKTFRRESKINVDIDKISELKTRRSQSIRKDSKGNKIIRGKDKKHHITFRDYISKKGLVDYVNVTSFKQLNMLSTIEHNKLNSQNMNDNQSCTCLLI